MPYAPRPGGVGAATVGIGDGGRAMTVGRGDWESPLKGAIALLTAAAAHTAAGSYREYKVRMLGPMRARFGNDDELVLGQVAADVFDAGVRHRVSIGLSLTDQAAGRLR